MPTRGDKNADKNVTVCARGLECYISEHSGFCGQLKKFCEDFQVTEIDESGCLVKLTSQDVQPNVAKDVEKCHRNVIKDCSKNDDGMQPAGGLVSCGGSCNTEKTANVEKNIPSQPTNKHLYQLADITSPDTIQIALYKLTDLLGETKVLYLKDMYSNMQTDAETLHLGCFNSKNDRAIVHLNTRMVFPGIKTETIHQDGDYLITASIDPVFLEFLALFSDKVAVESLMRFCCCIDKNTCATFDLPFCTEKDKRTKIHRSLAKHFGSFLESKTFASDKKYTNRESCIQIRIRQKKGSRKGSTQELDEKKPSKNQRDKDLPVIYTGFVLKKENMETLEAIERLSRALGTHPSSFSFAGIKDKKAVTLQNVIVKGITPEQLALANTNESLSNIAVGNYRREKKPMEKGQHSGNDFRIVIRDVHLNSSKGTDVRCKDAVNKNINEAVENVKMHGFINYFGRQRFGQDGSTRADEVGLAMLQGNMVKAVKLLLRPSTKKDDASDAKRYFQETGDIPGTLSRMPQDRTRECLILKSLHRHGQDLDGCTKAFYNIPYSLRLLYAHSYVSLLWNKMASYRMKEYGVLNIVEGDLVHDSSSSGFNTSVGFGNASAASRDEEDRQLEVNIDTHSMRTAPPDERSKNVQTNKDNKKIHTDDSRHNSTTSIDKSQIKVVTKEDVRIAKYTIRDLVLPIPGYNVLYPTNRLKDRYQEALDKDGLTSKSFRIRSLGMTLPGVYRKVIAVPLDLEYKWVENNTTSVEDTKQSVGLSLGDQYPLQKNHTVTQISSLYVKSDDNFENTELREATNKRERNDRRVSNENEIDDLGQHEPREKRPKHFDDKSSNCIGNNVEISFKLQPSCYATVCLREMMKS